MVLCTRGRSLVVEDVEAAFARDDHIVAPVLVHVGDIELHPDADHIVRRRVVLLQAGVVGQVAKGEDVPLELAPLDVIPEGVERLAGAVVGAVVLTRKKI